MVGIDNLTGRLGNRLFQYAFLYAQVKEGKIPDVYVQDPKYFDKYRDELKQLLSDDIDEQPFVAIHVRRGDYVDNPFYVDLSQTDYYKNAIEMFPDDNFLVFSDDTDFASQMFTGIYDEDRFEVVKGQTELEDFNQMASCANGIIMANSSFSWWAAYLGNPDKKVIYPKQWFTDDVKRIGFLDNWTAI